MAPETLDSILKKAGYFFKSIKSKDEQKDSECAN